MPVVATGVMRSGVMAITSVRGDQLELGTPGTAVAMSGYLTRTSRGWRANGVAVEFKRAPPPATALVFIQGTVGAHGRLVVEALRADVPRPSLPRQDHSPPEAGPQVDRPDMERPSIEAPQVTRPQIERPETDR